VSIAASTLGNPELIILDEPLNGLDPEGMKEIRDLLLRFREEGRTLFISSHLLNEIERTCTHAAILRKGKILRNGPISELVSNRATAFLRSHDVQALYAAVREYPEALSSRVEGEGVTIDLKIPDTAALNRFLSERGIYLSHLTFKQQSLEDLFFEVTSESGIEPEEAA
jgi:ABC-2 type transport system ATP-binding protein